MSSRNHPRRSHRSFARVVFTLLAFVAISVSAGAQTLTFMAWSSPANEPFWSQYAATYESQNPGVKIDIQIFPWEQFWTKLDSLIAANQAPDMALLTGPSMARYAGLGVMANLDKLVAKGFSDSFVPSTWQTVSTAGYVGGMPVNFDGVGLYYNKDAFKAAGVTPPKDAEHAWSFSEFIQMATKVRAGSAVKYAIATPNTKTFYSIPLIYANGGTLLSRDLKTPTITDPRVREAFDFLLSWYDKKLATVADFDPNTQAQDLFVQGKAAMAIDGNWAIGRFAKEIKTFQWGVTYLPIGKAGKPASISVANVVGVFKGTQYPDKAWEFLKLWVEKPALKSYVERLSLIPARKDLGALSYVDAPSEMMNAFAQQLLYVPDQATREQLHPKIDQLMKVLDEQIELAAFDKKTVAKALQDTDSKWREMLK